jgi:hypothetical protein
MRRKVTGLSSIKLRLLGDGARVQFIFRVNENAPRRDVEIEIASSEAMALMVALQRLQVENRIPIPASLRPKGKPALPSVSKGGGNP